MTRIFALLYGLVSYLIFFATILYAIGFVDRLFVPKHIDSGPDAPWVQALWINLSLMTLFAVQHSVMARKSFKRWWTQYVPASMERSTYVLLASLSLVLLFWLWLPMPAIIWNNQSETLAVVLTGVSLLGWFIVFTSTFLINHFELFGLQQVVRNLSQQEPAAPALLSVRATSDLSRLHHRVLGDTDHDRRPSAIRSCDHGLYLRRHLFRGTRSGRSVRRRLSPLPRSGLDAATLAEVE